TTAEGGVPWCVGRAINAGSPPLPLPRENTKHPPFPPPPPLKLPPGNDRKPVWPVLLPAAPKCARSLDPEAGQTDRQSFLKNSSNIEACSDGHFCDNVQGPCLLASRSTALLSPSSP